MSRAERTIDDIGDWFRDAGQDIGRTFQTGTKSAYDRPGIDVCGVHVPWWVIAIIAIIIVLWLGTATGFFACLVNPSNKESASSQSQTGGSQRVNSADAVLAETNRLMSRYRSNA